VEERLGIAGSGTIACGLAAVAAPHGEVVLWARSDASAARAREQLRGAGGHDLAPDVRVTTHLGALANASFVVEAITEDPTAKADLYAQLHETLKADAVLATTTSSLSVRELAAAESAPAIVLSARLEAELGELEEHEQAEMRAGYGIDESGLGRIARAVWEAGGLITYFTAGEPEVRAWPCERDAPAPIAAGKIHTDFEKHFIRAEVTSVDELVAAGSMEALRAAGKLRVEGRDYRVQDGDVVFFRIGR